MPQRSRHGFVFVKITQNLHGTRDSEEWLARYRRSQIQASVIFSSTSCLSLSSVPVSSNEFVTAALPFSTLVMT